MILLIDVHYNEIDNSAHIAGIITDTWESDTIYSKYEIDKNGIDCSFIPGQFYKREIFFISYFFIIFHKIIN